MDIFDLDTMWFLMHSDEGPLLQGALVNYGAWAHAYLLLKRQNWAT